MKILCDTTWHWWQVGLAKVALLSLGIVIGVTWFDFFNLRDGLYLLLWLLFVVPGIYLVIVYVKQAKQI